MSKENFRGVKDLAGADRLLVSVARQGGAWVGAMGLIALVIAAAELALPAVIASAVDAVLNGRSVGIWVLSCGVLIAVLVICDALDDFAAGATVARSTASLRHGLVTHLLALGSRPARRLPAGEITARLVGNAAEAARVAPDIVHSVAGVVPALGAIVALALIDPWLCATFLAGMPVFVLALRVFARDASQVATRYLAVQGMIAGRLVDALAGARTIAAAGTAQREAQRVLGPLPALHRQGVAMWRAQMRITAQDMVLVSLLEIAVLAVAGALLADGRISPGELIAASQYVLLASGIGGAVTGMTRLVRSRAAATRVAEILDQAPLRYGTAPAPEGGGRIEFRGVSARAGDRTVLADIDLVIPPGGFVAVVGRSGSGKSLLAALAGRLVDPDAGAVLLDGIALPKLSRPDLRREIGYGFERPILIGETLADAIACGTEHPPREELVAAAGAARADDFIRRMPAGYDTPLSDAPMSGGEVQRVGLARTFAHARRVLVLDDVAASLDTVTEHHISAVLSGALADRTRMVIAHRASTAARADAVIWLEDGTIRAKATHEQLWHDPDYRALFEAHELAAAGAVTANNGGPL
ncbi:MAG: ATP-binding cassette, subfamily bacterial RamA/AmfB [Solirubrobacteraceae bacterium]|nr:ATP-binding cassette, subfamily bacterial RamA/AmfB [Solirubrobacteraceae bacterium]